MPRVTCRCGEKLKVDRNGPERVDCPKCGARIRLRRSPPPQISGQAGDGFLRFLCPCGRRLKVTAAATPLAGKCPDCGRVVPVPTSAQGMPRATSPRSSLRSDPEARTEELDDGDLAELETWRARHISSSNPAAVQDSSTTGLHVAKLSSDPGTKAEAAAPRASPNSVVRFEAGLRVCPRCKKPVHLGAATCRECGTPVPRQ
jgi:hypothetical protein